MNDRYNTYNDGGNADQTSSDFRSRKKLFRGNDNRNRYHYERIHDAKNELNCHQRRAAGATSYTLFAAKQKTCFILRTWRGTTIW